MRARTSLGLSLKSWSASQSLLQSYPRVGLQLKELEAAVRAPTELHTRSLASIASHRPCRKERDSSRGRAGWVVSLGESVVGLGVIL